MTDPTVLATAKSFTEPIGKKSPYKTSRLMVLEDGTTMPVLTFLAKAKFTSWDEDQFPFWIDGNYKNEIPENVGLATSLGGRSKKLRRPRSAYGVPAGTKEYMRAWRAAHKDSVKASQKKYTDKQRLVLERFAAGPTGTSVLAKLEAAIEEEGE
jgi:hypothetical protein